MRPTFLRTWTASVQARWSDLGIHGRQPVRNLWMRQDEGLFDFAYQATVPRHGAVMLRVGQPEEPAGIGAP